MNEARVPISEQDPILRVRGLSVDIDVPSGELHAVSKVGFEVKAGETLCLVGESGCGKSMTALSLMRLLPRRARLRADEIFFEGRDISRLSDSEFAKLRGDRLGMIFQDPMTSLNPVYSIGNQLEETYLAHRSASRRQARERAVEVMETVGLKGARQRLGQFPHQLSGGQRQRIMIAMTLMCEPSLLIADEPTTALDVTVQVQVLQLLKRLQLQQKMGLILITHDLGVVARMADHVAVMYAGTVVEHGTSQQVFAAPHHPYTRALRDCIPVARGGGVRTRLGAIAGTVPSLIGQMTGCQFRNRCEFAGGACEAREIALRELPDGQRYRCVIDPVTIKPKEA